MQENCDLLDEKQWEKKKKRKRHWINYSLQITHLATMIIITPSHPVTLHYIISAYPYGACPFTFLTLPPFLAVKQTISIPV